MFGLAVTACAVTACAVFGGTPGLRLEIRDADSGRLYGEWPLCGGEFSVEFVHSVNQSPVTETFEARDGRIAVKSVRFAAFGAGMQSDLGPGETLSRDGDALLITGFCQTYSELRYIVGTVSDHVLRINGSLVSLREICGKNAHVILKIKGNVRRNEFTVVE